MCSIVDGGSCCIVCIFYTGKKSREARCPACMGDRYAPGVDGLCPRDVFEGARRGAYLVGPIWRGRNRYHTGGEKGGISTGIWRGILRDIWEGKCPCSFGRGKNNRAARISRFLCKKCTQYNMIRRRQYYTLTLYPSEPRIATKIPHNSSYPFRAFRLLLEPLLFGHPIRLEIH